MSMKCFFRQPTGSSMLINFYLPVVFSFLYYNGFHYYYHCYYYFTKSILMFCLPYFILLIPLLARALAAWLWILLATGVVTLWGLGCSGKHRVVLVTWHAFLKRPENFTGLKTHS